MKKVLSLILALVMAMTALTGIALAETTEEDQELAAFLSMVEEFFSSEEEPDLEAILGELLKAEHEDVVKAESIDQFYGDWIMTGATIFGLEIPQEEILDTEHPMLLVITEKGIFLDAEDGEETALELRDGILVCKDADFVTVHLTETGVCFSVGAIMDLDFKPADPEKRAELKAENYQQTSNLSVVLNDMVEEEEADDDEEDLAALFALLGGIFGEEETSEDEADLAALLSMLDELFSEEDEDDLTALLGLIGGLFDDEEENEEDDDLGALLGLLGELFSEEQETRTAEDKEEAADLIALLELLFGEGEQTDENLFAKITMLTHGDVIKAESIDQFYGTFALTGASLFGEEVPASELDDSETTTLIINEKGIFFDEVDDEETPLVLKGGILLIDEDSPISIHLTADGVCFTLLGILDLDFAAAK